MTDRIIAPWTEQQVAALNAFQRSGRMHPFTCGAPHGLHQTLIAETDGWHCPDEACDYRQNWAHAFMADRTLTAAAYAMEPPHRPPERNLAAELRRVRAELRETQQQLGEERQASVALHRRLETAEARVRALEVHTALSRVAAVDVHCGEILGGKPLVDAGSIDTWEETADA